MGVSEEHYASTGRPSRVYQKSIIVLGKHRRFLEEYHRSVGGTCPRRAEPFRVGAAPGGHGGRGATPHLGQAGKLQ